MQKAYKKWNSIIHLVQGHIRIHISDLRGILQWWMQKNIRILRIDTIWHHNLLNSYTNIQFTFIQNPFNIKHWSFAFWDDCFLSHQILLKFYKYLVNLTYNSRTAFIIVLNTSVKLVKQTCVCHPNISRLTRQQMSLALDHIIMQC